MEFKTKVSDCGVVCTTFPDLGIEFHVDQYQTVKDGGWLDVEIWCAITGDWIKNVSIKETEWWADGVRVDVLHGWAQDIRKDITLADYDEEGDIT
jgi:hypothetical protein